MKSILRPINPKDSNENKSHKKFQLKFNKRPWLIAGGVLAVFIVILAVIGYFFAFAPAMKIKAKGMEVADEAKNLQADIKLNDIDLIDARVNTLVEKYAAFEKESESMY